MALALTVDLWREQDKQEQEAERANLQRRGVAVANQISQRALTELLAREVRSNATLRKELAKGKSVKQKPTAVIIGTTQPAKIEEPCLVTTNDVLTQEIAIISQETVEGNLTLYGSSKLLRLRDGNVVTLLDQPLTLNANIEQSKSMRRWHVGVIGSADSKGELGYGVMGSYRYGPITILGGGLYRHGAMQLMLGGLW